MRRTKAGSTPKPDYNLIARLEVELGIVDPPVVVEKYMTPKQFLSGLGGEEWFKMCRGDTDAGLD